MRSHLTVAEGVELVIEPGRAGLSPEQVRHLIRGVMAVFAQVTGEQANDAINDQKTKPTKSPKGVEK